MSRNLAFFLFLAMFFISCEKEIISVCEYSTVGSPPTFYLDSSIRACSYFSASSYWIYQSNLNELDTQEVVYNSISIGANRFNCKGDDIVMNYEENATMDVMSSFYNVTFVDLVTTIAQDDRFLRTEVARIRIPTGAVSQPIPFAFIIYNQEEQQILFEFEEVKQLASAANTNDKQVEILTDFIFQDTVFSKVYKMSNVRDYFYDTTTPTDDVFEMYFVEGIGMIKRYNPSTNKDWELIDYQVYQW